MKMKAIVGGVIGVAVLLFGWYYYQQSAIPGEYDEFAQCIADSGAKFYGAFWCPHCQAQEKMFGSSAEFLPYIECSTPDGQKQLQICIDEGINQYPTWEFADGSRLTGEIELEKLAEKTGCELSRE